jgi:hypothetical protein
MGGPTYDGPHLLVTQSQTRLSQTIPFQVQQGVYLISVTGPVTSSAAAGTNTSLKEARKERSVKGRRIIILDVYKLLIS